MRKGVGGEVMALNGQKQFVKVVRWAPSLDNTANQEPSGKPEGSWRFQAGSGRTRQRCRLPFQSVLWSPCLRTTPALGEKGHGMVAVCTPRISGSPVPGRQRPGTARHFDLLSENRPWDQAEIDCRRQQPALVARAAVTAPR